MTRIKLSGKKTALIASAAIAALVLGSTGVFAQTASQAFAQVQNQNAQPNNSTNNGDNDGRVLKAMVKDIRDHRGQWTGLTTVSHSLVPNVRILGVVEKSSDTVSVTLAHIAKSTADNSTTIDNTAVTQNLTLVAIAGHERMNPNAHLDGSTLVSSGWSGVTTVDLKLDGRGSLFNYHLIRVVAVDYTGGQ